MLTLCYSTSLIARNLNRASKEALLNESYEIYINIKYLGFIFGFNIQLISFEILYKSSKSNIITTWKLLLE